MIIDEMKSQNITQTEVRFICKEMKGVSELLIIVCNNHTVFSVCDDEPSSVIITLMLSEEITDN